MNYQVKRCTKCILSEKFPKIKYNDNGVCNFCSNDILYTTNNELIDSAKDEVVQLLNDFKNKGEYDAIVCYSGGKDSTYTLQLAVKKYKLKVLSFTLDNGFLSAVALENINRVVDSLGVDHITYKPSYKFMKDLFRLSSLEPIFNASSLTRISANCNSCISIVNNTALKLALEKEIPFILAGFTLGQIPANTICYKNNYAFFRESRKPILDKLKNNLGNDVARYMEINERLLNNSNHYPYNINLLCLENISDHDIIENIIPLGWKKPDDVDGCSTNCRINSFNNFVHFKRYGYSPYELELSHLIRKNLLSREEALLKLNDQPQKQIDSALKELGITADNIKSF